MANRKAVYIALFASCAGSLPTGQAGLPAGWQASVAWAEPGILAEARSCMAHRQWGEALKHLNIASKKQPDSSEIWDKILECAGRLGRANEQIEAAQKLLRWRPADIVLYNQLHALYGRQGRLERGLWYGEQAVRLAPAQAELHYNLGVTYNLLGRHSKSIAAYREAVRLDPEYVEAHLNLANLYRKTGRGDQALAAAERVLKLVPDYYKGRLIRGAILEDRRRYAEAVADYQAATLIRPGPAEAYRYLGLAYHAWGRDEEALKACQEGLSHSPQDAGLQACQALAKGNILDPAVADRLAKSSLVDIP